MSERSVLQGQVNEMGLLVGLATVGTVGLGMMANAAVASLPAAD